MAGIALAAESSGEFRDVSRIDMYTINEMNTHPAT
jgi:hypothetical protein